MIIGRTNRSRWAYSSFSENRYSTSDQRAVPISGDTDNSCKSLPMTWVWSVSTCTDISSIRLAGTKAADRSETVTDDGSG